MSEVKTKMSIKDIIRQTKQKKGWTFMSYYRNLSATIEDSDIKIKELAEYVGVSTKQVQRWKKGTSEMGIDKLKKVCQYYGVSADYILGLPKGLQWPR